MRVLWLCNLPLPMVAAEWNIEPSNKEGWVAGLANTLLLDDKNSKLTLGVCFPIGKLSPGEFEKKEMIQGKNNIVLLSYGFGENTTTPEEYDDALEKSLTGILEDFKPDVVHCFGTEYPHTLALLKSIKQPEKVLVGIQGLCFAIAEEYVADLPAKVINRVTLRDFLRKDSIRRQQEKFFQRGELEKEALKKAVHVAGRTQWDKEMVYSINPKLQYHVLGETLRPDFYEGEWQEKKCIPQSIFVSQGDYPLKGLHLLLEAMPELLKKYPKLQVCVAGQSIVNHKTIKEKLKLSSYGKYLIDSIRKSNLEGHVTFLGKLTAKEMKEQLLRSSLFLCSSVLENSPNSLGEAMLLGVPCAAARVGGIPSMMAEDEGILYQAKSKEELINAVQTMFENRELREAYRKKARQHALQNHNQQDNYRALCEIYKSIYEDNDKEL